MRSKPMIGLNADFRSAKKDAPAFTFISAGYYDAIAATGGIPVILPPLANEADLRRVLELLDGLVLVGGADLDPRRDGFMSPSDDPPDGNAAGRLRPDAGPDRGRASLGVVRHRGRNARLNISQGGNLLLHIPEDLPKAIPHKDPIDPAHRHGLEVVPGSLMERVYGDGEIRVNSLHHMAVIDRNVAPRLPRVTGPAVRTA